MQPFYCLVHTPEAITPELCVLAADNEADALLELDDVAAAWPRLERVELYRGDLQARVLFAADFPLAWIRAGANRARQAAASPGG